MVAITDEPLSKQTVVCNLILLESAFMQLSVVTGAHQG